MRCYTVDEVANRLNVCRDTVFRLIRVGKLEKKRLHTGKRGKPKTLVTSVSLGNYLLSKEDKKQ